MRSNGEMFQAICNLAEQNKSVDSLTVQAELIRMGIEPDMNRIERMAASVPSPGHALSYAGLVVEEAQWRVRLQASYAIASAVGERDSEAMAEAQAMLEQDLVHHDSDYEPHDLTEIGHRLLEGQAGAVIPWPFEQLNRLTAGGMRRGQMILLAGHTSHGKSFLLDQILERASKDCRVRLYMNEMTLEERLARRLSRQANVPYERLMEGRLDGEQRSRVEKELGKGQPYGITYCPGWSAEDIANHIRAHRWDLAAVDILHRIPYKDTRELDLISSNLANCAKQSNTALILVSHLNEGRVIGAVRPRPTLGDIRGTGSLKNDADVVLFLYRKQSEEGEPTDEAAIYFAKVRGGRVGGLKARFSPRLRFEVGV
jgi:replicative DNA helicase